MTDGYSFTFPTHAEPLIREALKAVIERIPLGWSGPMTEVVILPLAHVGLTPSVPRFTLVGEDCQPEPASGVAEDPDNA